MFPRFPSFVLNLLLSGTMTTRLWEGLVELSGQRTTTVTVSQQRNQQNLDGATAVARETLCTRPIFGRDQQISQTETVQYSHIALLIHITNGTNRYPFTDSVDKEIEITLRFVTEQNYSINLFKTLEINKLATRFP